jgi:hypothetical protein
MEDVLFCARDDCVAGVVAAGIAHNDLRLVGQQVNDLSLAFITPLGAYDNQR